MPLFCSAADKTGYDYLRQTCHDNEQISRLKKFRQEPPLIDVATFEKLAEFCPYEIMSNLHDAPDEVRARSAEMFDLYAIIRPDKSG